MVVLNKLRNYISIEKVKHQHNEINLIRNLRFFELYLNCVFCNSIFGYLFSLLPIAKISEWKQGGGNLYHTSDQTKPLYSMVKILLTLGRINFEGTFNRQPC